MVEKFLNLASSREDILQFLIIVMHMQEYAVKHKLRYFDNEILVYIIQMHAFFWCTC